jgi:hypothetical protein
MWRGGLKSRFKIKVGLIAKDNIDFANAFSLLARYKQWFIVGQTVI